jgi:hypothetical protein
MRNISGLILALLWLAAGCGADGDGGSDAATVTVDCEEFAAVNCDPACDCHEGPGCAAASGDRPAVVWPTREHCVAFYKPTCDFIVGQGGAADLAAQFQPCREDLATAECQGEGAESALRLPMSCENRG